MFDIVIDNNIMHTFDKPKEECYKLLFNWIKEIGTLTVSNKLINEYFRSQGGCGDISGLINKLIADGRFIKVTNDAIKSFKLDNRYNYKCNYLDIDHARLTFLSIRKLLISEDDLLLSDVNGFKKIDGVQPMATKNLNLDFMNKLSKTYGGQVLKYKFLVL